MSNRAYVGEPGGVLSLLRAVIDTEDHEDFGVIDPIDDNKWQSRHDHFKSMRYCAFVAHTWKFRKTPDSFPYTSAHAASRLFIMLTNERRDVLQMLARTRRTPHDHRPKSFQTATISLSLTNSPLSASAIDSLRSAICF